MRKLTNKLKSLMPGKTIFGDHDNANTMLAIHQASMAKDPVIACQGRLGKTMLNTAHNFLEDECNRQTDTGIVLTSALSNTTNFVITIMFNIYMNSIWKDETTIKRIRDRWVEMIDDSIAEAKLIAEKRPQDE